MVSFIKYSIETSFESSYYTLYFQTEFLVFLNNFNKDEDQNQELNFLLRDIVKQQTNILIYF